MTVKHPAAALALFCAFGGDALAELTPMGAETAGNADGSIPVWSEMLNDANSQGGPSNYLADPYPGDKPLFVISAQNVGTYASRLSAGHRALFARHGGYSMPVFPSRRNVSFPREVYEASARNTQTAKMHGVDEISGVRLGIPFLRPRSGIEVLWNHRLRYRFDSAVWHYTWGVVRNNGSKPETGQVEERVLARYANTRDPADLTKEDVHSYTEMSVSACEGRSMPAAAVWHDPVNALANSRKLWVHFMGRTMRTPSLGYDTVDLCSHFIRYFDMFDMFYGGFDRYVFKLIGKRELYVPYNSFRLASAEGAEQLLNPGHLAQTRARYELHRVWQVEASLRPGAKHAIAKRVFYVDEDTWCVIRRNRPPIPA